jgi:hypothetical protein
MPMPPLEKEVKLAFMSKDTAKAFTVLGLSDPHKGRDASIFLMPEVWRFLIVDWRTPF